MKHLFIVNPGALMVKGRVGEVTEEIKSYFAKHPLYPYDIHITRWNRDATGYVRRYLSETEEMVRLHCFGGAGTLFEAVNGAVEFSNAQIAAYPMGASNELLRYFGKDTSHLFRSIHSQVTSGTTPLDAIRCGNLYGISHVLIGLEARSNRDGDEMIERTSLPSDFCHTWTAAKEMITGRAVAQRYKIDIDGVPLDGDYISVMIANGPCYGKDMCPAIDAHPNDGHLEIYMLNAMSIPKLIAGISPYTMGKYRKIKGFVRHCSGEKIRVSSDEVMCLCLDGEVFYQNTAEFEVLRHAVDFVCPDEIDITKLPRIYNHPEEGYIGEQ